MTAYVAESATYICVYAGDDPVNEADPSGLSVNLQGVAQWAKQNVGGGDNGYKNDCADFVSRALASPSGGDDPENVPGWLPAALTAAGPFAAPGVARLAGLDDHYWYRFGYDIFDTAQSYSWSVAYDLAEHLKLNGSQWLVNAGTSPTSSCGESNDRWNQVTPGDIIFANWSGSNFSGISHVGVITSTASQLSEGLVYITQHTPPQLNTPLSNWLQNGGSDVHVWVVAPNER